MNADFNYDNMWNGFLATFTFTAGGWGGMVNSMVDVTEIDYNAGHYHSPMNVIFIMLGVCFFGFYLSNLFVGIVFETYGNNTYRTIHTIHTNRTHHTSHTNHTNHTQVRAAQGDQVHGRAPVQARPELAPVREAPA